MEETFAIALSEKTGEEATKEASLKIKSLFPKAIKYLLLFFTPHYQPAELIKTVDFTLDPALLIGIQAPLLIFEDRIIEKGIAACCINKNETALKEIFIKKDDFQNIELCLRRGTQKLAGEKQFLFSFLTPAFSPANYVRGVGLSLGKALNITGAGYIRKYAAKGYQIINRTADEGLLNIIGRGIKITSLKINGFFPVGNFFTITRAISERNIILEINGAPAIDIYKHYFEEKFDVFRKNRLFSLYPLGIEEEDQTHLINVIDCLEDGSLVCIGEVKEGCRAHFMLLHPPSLLQSLPSRLAPLKKDGEGLVFMINSLTRKKLLKDSAEDEIRIIKQCLGPKFKTIGIYSDYCFFSNQALRNITLESSSLLISLWR